MVNNKWYCYDLDSVIILEVNKDDLTAQCRTYKLDGTTEVEDISIDHCAFLLGFGVFEWQPMTV